MSAEIVKNHQDVEKDKHSFALANAQMGATAQITPRMPREKSCARYLNYDHNVQ